VQPATCHEWVREYLGDRPSQEDCQKLLEAISVNFAVMATWRSRKLLTELQSADPANQAPQAYSGVLKEVQKLYSRWVDQHS